MIMITLPKFDIRTCKSMSPEWCQEHGFWPNRVYTRRGDEGERIAFVVVRKAASSGDFALSKAGLDYAVNTATIPAFVVLAEADNTPVATVPVAEMAQRLAGGTPKTGTWGPYFWLNSNGYPSSGYYDDVPF